MNLPSSALEPAFYVHSICYCYSSLFWISGSGTWSILVELPSFLLFPLSEVLPFSLFITTAVRIHLRTVQKNKLSRIREALFLQCASLGPRAAAFALQVGFCFVFVPSTWDVANSKHVWQ